jgi:flagellar motor switch protein FliG
VTDRAVNLNGTQKAAIFLMTLGESAAAEVVKHLGPKEVQTIGAAMAAMQNVSRDMVKHTVDDFFEHLQKQTPIGIGADDYIRKVLTDGLGEDKAGGVIDRILCGGKSSGLDSLKWMDARTVLQIVKSEHPQVIAIVLSYLESDQAAEVLELLPEALQSDVVVRIATMDGVQPAAMNELNEMLQTQLQSAFSSQASTLGGPKCAAGILNFVNRGVEAAISEKITETDAELAEKMQDLMFAFDNLAEIDDRGIQTLLREVSTENLVIALKGTDDTIQNKIFGNMSERAAEMLKDDLEVKGPVKLSEVEAAQKEIIAIARRLADEGQISLGAAGGEEMV